MLFFMSVEHKWLLLVVLTSHLSCTITLLQLHHCCCCCQKSEINLFLSASGVFAEMDQNLNQVYYQVGLHKEFALVNNSKLGMRKDK